jgi:CHASE2 domain-containing sensor protein
VKGIVLGIVIHVALVLLRPTGVARGIEERALDAIIYGAGFQPATARHPLDPAFLFLDIDDATVEAWPQVPYTPRDRLARLVTFAIESGASVVLVDVNLTHPIGGARGALSNEDAELVRAFRRFALEPGERAGCRHALVVLNREFRRSEGTCREVRPSFLDEAFADGAAPFLFGSVDFELDPDHRIRRWRLAEKTCTLPDAGGAVQEVPSVQLVVSGHLRDLARGEACAEPEPRSVAHELGGLREPDEVADRIVYGIPWKLRPGETRPTVVLDGRRVPVLTIVSAKDVTEHAGRVSGELARGRVVVIGGSSEDSRDLVSTPIGEMPGALVLVNSIYSLSRFGQLAPAPRAAETALALFSIVLASLLLAAVRGALGYLLLAAGTAVVFVPLSLWALRTGNWVDWTLPLVAIAIHHVVERIEERLSGSHHAGGKKS